jgi:hypothetical protein
MCISNGNTYEQFDETIFKLEAFQSESFKNKEGYIDYKMTALKIEKCNFDKFSPFHREVFNGVPTYNMFCLEDTFSVEGTYFSVNFRYLLVKVSECKNTTEYQKCKSKAVIDKNLKLGFFTFAYTDINIDPTNYTNPNQIYNPNAYVPVSNEQYREVTHNQKLVRINTDKGWLFTDSTTEDYIQSDNAKELVLNTPKENFLNYFFRFGNKVDTYNRSYTKIQNVAANIGGILKIFVIICQSIVKVLSIFMARRNILNMLSINYLM